MEQSAPFETITKLEAAERQLCVAIRLFFERRDIIAVHTLAAAAQGVLRDLGRRRGFVSIFEEGAARIIPEKRDEFVRLFRDAQNFFKHAHKDPDAKLEFYADATKFYLMDAARLLVSMTGRHNAETAALTGFFVCKYPNIFNFDDIPDLQRVKELAAKINADDFETILFCIDRLKLSV